eukprot:TRINITY_DN3555_c0_g1_i2.p1 TRINITY_DN3555_c0_g1~~TRINITY_DN3555_c0_g1_i2.p1  ORF type:complete len:211 (+),score=51.72 TRINITY_DN3555_c0_g1_i2:144-776(+)
MMMAAPFSAYHGEYPSPPTAPSSGSDSNRQGMSSPKKMKKGKHGLTIAIPEKKGQFMPMGYPEMDRQTPLNMNMMPGMTPSGVLTPNTASMIYMNMPMTPNLNLEPGSPGYWALPGWSTPNSSMLKITGLMPSTPDSGLESGGRTPTQLTPNIENVLLATTPPKKRKGTDDGSSIEQEFILRGSQTPTGVLFRPPIGDVKDDQKHLGSNG